VSDQTDNRDDAADTERKLREHEQEARRREGHEQDPESEREAQDRPAPPGPESQQPRG
jgi:hypothetical protein